MDFHNGNLEVLVTVFQYGTKIDFAWYVAGVLDTNFYGDSYVITLGNDTVIELDFSNRFFEVCNDGKLEGLVVVLQNSINDDVS